MIILLGASKGIGKDLIPSLTNIDHVICCSRTGKVNKYKNASNYKIDITSETEIDSFIASNKKLKKISVIFCASFKKDTLLVQSKKSDIDLTIDTNIKSIIDITKKIIPIMIKQKYGRLIYLSSSEAASGSIGTSLYSMSKSALNGFSGSISKEYGNFNITSNIIELGAFNTGMYKKLDTKIKKQIKSNIPSKKLGKMLDIFNTIDFIIKTEFLNGSIIKLNGGSKY
tara:strand:+ start:554 stop:1234 length:681 start_codon:yes stop_codon:yes gene_type:complete